MRSRFTQRRASARAGSMYKPTDADRAALREKVLEVLVNTRRVLRPSELLHEVSKDPRFIAWPSCMHVSYQLQALRKARKVRRVWMPTGPERNYGWRTIRPGYHGWAVADIKRSEVTALRNVTHEQREPLRADQPIEQETNDGRQGEDVTQQSG